MRTASREFPVEPRDCERVVDHLQVGGPCGWASCAVGVAAELDDLREREPSGEPIDENALETDSVEADGRLRLPGNGAFALRASRLRA